MKHLITNKNSAWLIALLLGIFTTNTLYSQEQDLLKRVKDSDVNGVKELIASGAELNFELEDDLHGMTPLGLSIMMNNLEMAKILIDAGADVNTKNYLGGACANKRVEMVKLLIAEGADVNREEEISGSVYTPLIQALPNAELTKILIDAGADVNHRDKIHGSTPLIQASKSYKPEAVKMLMDAGADINARETVSGYTPLIYACQYNFQDLVKYLIDEGADVNLKGQDGTTALLEVASRSQELTEQLLSKGADLHAKKEDGSGIFLQCIRGVLFERVPIEMAEWLLSKGAHVDESPASGPEAGGTALMLASAFNKKELVKFLIQKGANVNTKANDGSTALSLATAEGHQNIVELLKANGAK
jgi:ankyrin repeat protein